MPFISSKWQITLGSATLLEVGEILNDEAQISRTYPVDIAPVIGTDNPAIFPRKNALFQLSFKRVKIFDSDNEARGFLFTYPGEFPTILTDCVITDGPLSMTLADATFEQSGYSSTTESDWFIADHRIVGGSLSISGITPPVTEFILTELGDFILLETADKILLE